MGHLKASSPQGTGGAVAVAAPQPVENDQQPPFQGIELTQIAPGQLVSDQVVGDPVCPPGAEAKLEDQTSRLPFVQLMAAYLCLCACYFTSFLDSNAVATALPTMGAALGAGPSITCKQHPVFISTLFSTSSSRCPTITRFLSLAFRPEGAPTFAPRIPALGKY